MTWLKYEIYLKKNAETWYIKKRGVYKVKRGVHKVKRGVHKVK